MRKKLDIESYRNPYKLYPQDYQTVEELLDAFEYWWTKKQRKGKESGRQSRNALERMHKNEYFPVDLFNLNPQQVISYLDYRENIEKAPPTAVPNDWKHINRYGRAIDIDISRWGYTPPSIPTPKVKIIPLPNEVYQIIHHKYSTDKYTNALYQHILTHGFLIGWRPSELVIQKIANLFLDRGYIIITETKKHNQLRQIFPEKEILSLPNRKTLENWLIWRFKIDTDNDYLYVQKNGRPFSVAYLRKKLVPLVKEVYPYFSLYTMRHWCAIARLIESYIETGNWDKTDVQDWLGHDDVKTTDKNYTRFAKKYYKIAPNSWIKAILKRPKWLGENSLGLKNSENFKYSNPTNWRNEERICRDLNPS